MARSSTSPATSGDWKRNLSAGVEEQDDSTKRRSADFYSSMNMPGPSYGGVHTLSYPSSSLSYRSQGFDEADLNRPYGYHSWSSSADLTCRGGSSYGQPSDSYGGHDGWARASATERYGYSGYSEPGYPGQYDFHEYPRLHEGDAGWRDDGGEPLILSASPPPTKSNRFSLSRYQVDDGEDEFADHFAVTNDVKPSRFRTQRERLMQAMQQENEDSCSHAQEETVPAQEPEDSSSHDSIMPQRERLRQFRNEHAHRVVIPIQWEGEKNLHEYVTFGDIEAALRPLGLMMARAALVNDSVTTGHLRSPPTGPRGRHSDPLPAHL